MNIDITTSRTRLRPITVKDLEFIHRLHSYPEVAQYNTLEIPKSKQDTRALITSWIKEGNLRPIVNYTLAIEYSEMEQTIGLFGLKLGHPKYRRAEVWYKILPSYWNQGFATEVLLKIIAFGFQELQLHRIEAGCAIDNIASIKVLEKVGMQREAHRRQILPLQSGWSDNYEYALLAKDMPQTV